VVPVARMKLRNFPLEGPVIGNRCCKGLRTTEVAARTFYAVWSERRSASVTSGHSPTWNRKCAERCLAAPAASRRPRCRRAPPAVRPPGLSDDLDSLTSVLHHTQLLLVAEQIEHLRHTHAGRHRRRQSQCHVIDAPVSLVTWLGSVKTRLIVCTSTRLWVDQALTAPVTTSSSLSLQNNWLEPTTLTNIS